MTDVKWIKIVTDIFNDEKMYAIECMPDGDTIQLIWFKLLCLTGNCNSNGMLIINNKFPYTDEMLSKIFRKEIGIVQRALDIFENLEMIEIVDNAYMISNWSKYQNVAGLDKIREQNRLRQQKYRDNQKLIASNVTDNVTDNVKNNVNCSYSLSISNNIYILLKDNSKYMLSDDYINELKETYPNVDVMSELTKMKMWCDSNPRKRKTESGIKRFINTWLNKRQSTTLDENLEKLFYSFVKSYPNKNKPEMAKPKFSELVKDYDDANRLYHAFLCYKDDYVKSHGDDDFNKFCPNLASWLENDSRYWLKVYERESNG